MKYYLIFLSIILLYNVNTPINAHALKYHTHDTELNQTVTNAFERRNSVEVRNTIKNRINELREQNIDLSTLPEIVIPINPIILEDTPERDIINITAIQKLIDSGNEFYRQINIRFELCGLIKQSLVDDLESLNISQATLTNELEPSIGKPNTMNAFFFDRIPGVGGVSSLPGGGNDVEGNWVVLTNTSTPEIIVHELGHFFGLFHINESFLGTEFVNGSNCEVAGDLICDTPAAPFIVSDISLNMNCQLSRERIDPNGDVFVSDFSNIMNPITTGCRTTIFTHEQLLRIRATAETIRNNFFCDDEVQNTAFDAFFKAPTNDSTKCSGQLDGVAYNFREKEDGSLDITFTIDDSFSFTEDDSIFFIMSADELPDRQELNIIQATPSGSSFSESSTLTLNTNDNSVFTLNTNIEETPFYQILFEHSQSNGSRVSYYIYGSCTDRLNAVNNLTSELSRKGVVLNWEDTNRNESGFSIERRDKRGYFYEIAQVDENQTHFIDRDVKTGDVTYRVKAFITDVNEGEYSNESDIFVPLYVRATALLALFKERLSSFFNRYKAH